MKMARAKARAFLFRPASFRQNICACLGSRDVGQKEKRNELFRPDPEISASVCRATEDVQSIFLSVCSGALSTNSELGDNFFRRLV